MIPDLKTELIDQLMTFKIQYTFAATTSEPSSKPYLGLLNKASELTVG